MDWEESLKTGCSDSCASVVLLISTAWMSFLFWVVLALHTRERTARKGPTEKDARSTVVHRGCRSLGRFRETRSFHSQPSGRAREGEQLSMREAC